MKWTELLNSERPRKTSFSENDELALSPFERDYYTIINSSYFRRLQNKTQVYTLDDSDFVRTRLTHSMEVSSIAEILGKRIAARVISENRETELPEDFKENLSMVLRCAGLLHDLGNPPFGHSGEGYIRDYFQEHEEELKQNLTEQMWLDFINFEGNAHNIRIVTKLGQSSNPNDNNYGMDLTYAVINSLIKYPFNSLKRSARNEDGSYVKRGKIGYYYSEEWIIAKKGKGVMSKTGTMTEDGRCFKNPIMLLMEASDDIAYATADVEDALKKGKINRNDFVAVLPESEQAVTIADDRDIQILLKKIKEQSMIDVVNYFFNHYEEIMAGQEGDFELVNGCQYNLGRLKGLLGGLFTQRDKLTEYKHSSRNHIMLIMDTLVKILLKEEKDRTLREILILNNMKQYVVKGREEVDYQSWLSDEEKSQEYLYHKYLAVVDFVSGMTDSYVKLFLDQINDEKYFEAEIEKLKDELLSDILNAKDEEIPEQKLELVGKIDRWSNLEISIILHACMTNEKISASPACETVIPYLLGMYKHSEATILSDEEYGQIAESYN